MLARLAGSTLFWGSEAAKSALELSWGNRKIILFSGDSKQRRLNQLLKPPKFLSLILHGFGLGYRKEIGLYDKRWIFFHFRSTCCFQCFA